MNAQTKPPFTYSIVNVYGGKTIPDTFLAKLNNENRSAFGFVVQEQSGLVIEKFDELDTSEKEQATQKKILEQTVKFNRMFIYCQFPAEFDEDEVPPYAVIRNSKKEPVLVIAIEGDFPGRTGTEGESEAFVVLNEWLGPKIEEMFKIFNNDPAKLTEWLKGDSFAKDFANVYSHRGIISVMPATGVPFMVGKNDIGEQFPWGEASMAYGYTESTNNSASPAPAAEAPAEKPKKVSRYATNAADPAPIPEPKKEEPKPDVKVPEQPKPVTDPVHKAADQVIEEIDWKPPPGVHGKKLKALYRQMNSGVLPTNWQDRPSLRIKAKTKVNDLKDLSQTAVGPLANAAAVAASTTAASASAKTAGDVTLPVISGDEQRNAVEFIKKHLGDSSKQLDESPLETQRMEEKLPVFSELVLKSQSLDELERWPTSGIFAFCKQNPEVAALALVEYRRDRINRKLSATQGDKKLGDLAGTGVHTPTPTAPIPEIPSKPAEHQPRKTSKYA